MLCCLDVTCSVGAGLFQRLGGSLAAIDTALSAFSILLVAPLPRVEFLLECFIHPLEGYIWLRKGRGSMAAMLQHLFR
jgi:hypothetical protein